jgi:hypothetical protein
MGLKSVGSICCHCCVIADANTLENSSARFCIVAKYFAYIAILKDRLNSVFGTTQWANIIDYIQEFVQFKMMKEKSGRKRNLERKKNMNSKKNLIWRGIQE